MADGRKNNGGPRPNAGRKPKDEELKELELIDSAIDPDQWKKLFRAIYLRAVNEEDTAAARLIIERRYGKAKETVDMKHTLDKGVKLPDFMQPESNE